MGTGYSPSKATIITDTAAHTGRFYKVEALKNSVIASMTSDSITENGSGAPSAIDIHHGACIEGVIFTSITLTSGHVVVYSV
tara:strand:- start:452 stop:697 length:246 start_codon:yes stop_codon:yes gene_type:complete